MAFNYSGPSVESVDSVNPPNDSEEQSESSEEEMLVSRTAGEKQKSKNQPSTQSKGTLNISRQGLWSNVETQIPMDLLWRRQWYIMQYLLWW